MSLTKARRAELEQELLATMDRVDALRLEHREAQRAAREELSRHEKKVRELRDLLSGREAEQTTIPGTETGTVKPRPAAPKKNAPGQTLADPVATRRRSHKFDSDNLAALCIRCNRPAGEHAGSRCPPKKKPQPQAFVPPSQRGMITRWAADARARKVPTFVIEMTGLFTKAEVVAKYGDTCVFEKGKPCPKAIGERPSDLALQKAKAKQPRLAPGALIRWSEPDRDGAVVGKAGGKTYRITPYPDGGCRWETPDGGGASPKGEGRMEEAKAICESRAKDIAQRAVSAMKTKAATPAGPRELSWTEGDGTLQAVAGTTTYRVHEITPTRWVLESKSERERSWHKEDVLESLNACESWVMRRHPGTTFAEACLTCGTASDKPSDGCLDCQHGRPAEDEEAVA